MKVVFDEAALGDIERIEAWIAKDNPAAAASVVNRIFLAAEHLGQFPHTGHPGRVDNTFEWVVSKLPYIMVYELDTKNDILIVIGVFHGARQQKRF